MQYYTETALMEIMEGTLLIRAQFAVVEWWRKKWKNF
jgi:hypothetical protein